MALTRFRDVAGAQSNIQAGASRAGAQAAGHPAGTPTPNPHAALFAAAAEGFRRAEMAAQRSLTQPPTVRP